MLQTYDGQIQALSLLKTLPVPETATQREIHQLIYQQAGGIPVTGYTTESADLLTMESHSQLAMKIIKAIIDAIWTTLRNITAFIARFIDRSRALQLELSNIRRHYTKAVGRKPIAQSFEASSTLAPHLRYGNSFGFDFTTGNTLYKQNLAIAEYLLSSSFRDDFKQFANTLDRALDIILKQTDTALIDVINRDAYTLLYKVYNTLNESRLVNVTLLGNRMLRLDQVTTSGSGSIQQSLAIQSARFEVQDIPSVERDMVVTMPSLEQVGVLLESVNTGVDLLVTYHRKKYANELLEIAGNLQAKLNDVYRQQGQLSVATASDDAMVALSRYLTAYTAWIKVPLVGYAEFFTNSTAAMLEVSREALKYYF